MSDGATADLRAGLEEAGYTVEEELGRGGSATVYRARDRKHQRSVAVKVLLREVADEIELERFAREIGLAASLAHPHILPVFDSGVVTGLPYYVTPLVDGRTLRDRLNAGPLSEAECLRIGIGIAEGLAFAHERGIIHRDIKPENVLLAGGEAVIADFGIATALDAAAHRPKDGRLPADRRLTGTGLVLGTPDYMSPEQASGEAVDARTDVFALGCVLFEMLRGEVPFGGSTYREMLATRLSATSDRILEQLSGIPAGLAGIIARCVAAAPAERYPDAGAVADALRGVAPDSGAMAVPARPARRWRAAVWATAALALVLTAIPIAARLWGADPRRVVILPLTDETDNPALATIGPLAADRLVAAIGALSGVEVVTSAVDVPSFRILRHGTPGPSAGDGLERLHQAATETRAGTVVSGSYYQVADSLELIVEVTEVSTGRLLRAIGPVHGSVTRGDSLIGVLAGSVAAAVDTLVGRDPGDRPR